MEHIHTTSVRLFQEFNAGGPPPQVGGSRGAAPLLLPLECVAWLLPMPHSLPACPPSPQDHIENEELGVWRPLPPLPRPSPTAAAS